MDNAYHSSLPAVALFSSSQSTLAEWVIIEEIQELFFFL